MNATAIPRPFPPTAPHVARPRAPRRLLPWLLGGMLALSAGSLQASIAYGSLNNFDTVNDTGQEAHGFEIELEDCQSTNISYTFDYNHYGVPTITQDNSVAGHPRTFIRWESKKNADGTWAAYTAIPSGPIAPTDGHMFTNPAINFGGEHFGAGYMVPVGAVHYYWLLDNGAGALVRGGAVQVSTPSFTYYPPAPALAVPAQVQAVIVPPAPPAPEPKEFGKAIWVKEIRTTSHNPNKVQLRELVSDDPNDAQDRNWKNGEPDEVETEWQILQKDYNKADGGPNNQVPAAAENLPGGDEVVTRRYEFFKYTGPLDNETGEAMAQAVGPDGIHGVGVKTINGVEVDLSTVAVVGEFTGSQMAAVDVAAGVGLIEHVNEGRVNEPYTARTVVVPGGNPVGCVREGALPTGMTFNEATGVLSGTPTQSGAFQFTVTAFDGISPDVAKTYTLLVAPANGELAPASLVDTTVSPVGSGTTSGDGSYAPGAQVTLVATAQPGFHFVNWTDNGKVVSTSATYAFPIDINHSLVAHFAVDVAQWTVSTAAAPLAGGSTSGGGTFDEGSAVTVVAAPSLGYAFTNWTENGVPVSTSASYSFTLSADRSLVAHFSAVPVYSVTTALTPAGAGTTSGGGSYSSGASATVTAVANAGYVFWKWTVSGAQVSTSPSYTFTVTGNRTLTANFVLANSLQTITTSANPSAGGTTSGGGSFVAGTTATVTAVAQPNYEFSKWQENGVTVRTSPTYSFTVTGSRNLVARFNEAFVVTATASPSAGGSTEMDSATYKAGENAKAIATPALGYTFTNWTENGVVVSTSATYSFSISGNRALVANFASTSGVTVTTNSAPAEGGTTSGDGVYQAGELVTVSALPSPGYGFASWTVNGAIVSTSADYSFTADSSQALVAHFGPAIAISATASPAAGGAIYGTGDYAAGASVTLEAVASADFAFRNWTEGGVVVSTSALYSFDVTTARNLVASFVPAYTIGAAAWPANGGTVLGAGSVPVGSSITLVAVPAGGGSFVSWTNAAGTVVSTSPSYTFTPAASGTFTANFSSQEAGIPFNFDSAAPQLALHSATPFTQSIAGLTASFNASTFPGPGVETKASTGQALSKFSGHLLAATGGQDTAVEVHFDAPIAGVSFTFATVEDPAVAVGSNIRLIATSTVPGSAPVVVGSAIAHGAAEPGDSLPSGTLTFNSAVPFDTILIELAAAPSNASGFLLDNLQVTPSGSTGGSMLLANPDWNITLTDFGYSDYLLDNTPGFEGREYLSGEWASAIAYVKDGVPVAPTWLDPKFLFPDWPSNSNFQVVEGIHLVAANAAGLPIAESIIANSDLEITLRFEMVDTVVGTPMGTTPASAGGPATSIDSNRYVLNQSFKVRNISGAAITSVQLFQLLHGYTSQHGVYDNRAYTGPLSQYRYDITLAGIDAGAAGNGSSPVGLEDTISLQARTAPTAFEVGAYGTQGNGIDDHVTGKPSDGVHLSIENNWTDAPFVDRKGRDSFAPAARWIAGGQRWALGNLAAGQTATFDLMLSLLTGTKVLPVNGQPATGSANGGADHVGGVDFSIEDATGAGTFFGEFSEADDDELAERKQDGQFALPTFQKPAGTLTQLWNLEYTGAHGGPIHLTFGYDPALLPAGFDESRLTIYHYNGAAWEELEGTVDAVKHQVSVTTSSLSPFALGLRHVVRVTVTTAAVPALGGTVSGGGTVDSGSSVTVSASPAAGYLFSHWSDGAGVVSTSPSYTLTASINLNLAAHFVTAVNLNATAAAGGHVQGAGAYATGGTATLTAIADAGYRFVSWTEGGVVVSTAATDTFAVGQGRTLAANFALIIPDLKMSAGAPGSLLLDWPADLPGWVLEESPDLSPGSWVPSARAATVNGNRKQVTVTPAGGQRFFRLSHP